jgi:hypothetical protein
MLFRAIAVASLHVARPALADVPLPPEPSEKAETPSPTVPEPSPSPAATSPSPAPFVSRAEPPAPTPAQLTLTRPIDAVVHLAATYDAARLEARSRVDTESWRVICDAPCDRSIRVEGLELRVTAPRMTPTNAFVVDPGPGVARFRVSGGSATARDLGIVGLAGGLPIAFAGMALFGLGSVRESSGERTGGIVTLAVGAAVVLIALPLLLVGSSSVKNEQGKYIARGAAPVPLL